LREATSSQPLWKYLCVVDFALKDLVDPSAAVEEGGARAAYISWFLHRKQLGFHKGLQENALRVSCPPSLAPLVLRTKAAWGSMNSFYSANLPLCATTLRPPLAAEGWVTLRDGLLEYFRASYCLDITNVQSILPGLSLLRLLLACHDGQEGPTSSAHMSAGCFGGYSAYDHFVSTRLLSAEEVLGFTKKELYAPPHNIGRREKYYVPVAMSVHGNKWFFLDLLTGSLLAFVGQRGFYPAITANGSKDSTAEAAAAEAALSGSTSTRNSFSCDGMLRWLEALAVRVSDGTFVASPLDPSIPETLGLCLFPQRCSTSWPDKPLTTPSPPPPPPGPAVVGASSASASAAEGSPLGNTHRDELPEHVEEEQPVFFTRTVTKGVEVCASVLFMPEQRQWTYSMRVRLLAPPPPSGLEKEEGEVPAPPHHQAEGAGSKNTAAAAAVPTGSTVAERGFETCQLLSRHWAITSPRGQVQHVRGEGVVGQFPLLREGAYRADQQTSAEFSPERLSKPNWEDGAFVYQSCSGRSEMGSTFGGELTFVPGSLLEPTGPPFQVVVAPFSLDIPRVLF
jgi:uncharacterized protein affecting Mg2+/Co2+ transport